MTATFASPEWVERLAADLEGSATVRTESMSWVFGPLLLVVDADSEHGFDATALRLDLHEGSVRAVQLVAADQSMRVPFAIGGSLVRWKTVFSGSLSLVDAILESKLRVRGDLPTLMRHRDLVDAIAASAGGIETKWQDEQEPAAASAG